MPRKNKKMIYISAAELKTAANPVRLSQETIQDIDQIVAIVMRLTSGLDSNYTRAGNENEWNDHQKIFTISAETMSTNIMDDRPNRETIDVYPTPIYLADFPKKWEENPGIYIPEGKAVALNRVQIAKTSPGKRSIIIRDSLWHEIVHAVHDMISYGKPFQSAYGDDVNPDDVEGRNKAWPREPKEMEAVISMYCGYISKAATVRDYPTIASALLLAEQTSKQDGLFNINTFINKYGLKDELIKKLTEFDMNAMTEKFGKKIASKIMSVFLSLPLDVRKAARDIRDSLVGKDRENLANATEVSENIKSRIDKSGNKKEADALALIAHPSILTSGVPLATYVKGYGLPVPKYLSHGPAFDKYIRAMTSPYADRVAKDIPFPKELTWNPNYTGQVIYEHVKHALQYNPVWIGHLAAYALLIQRKGVGISSTIIRDAVGIENFSPFLNAHFLEKQGTQWIYELKQRIIPELIGSTAITALNKIAGNICDLAIKIADKKKG